MITTGAPLTKSVFALDLAMMSGASEMDPCTCISMLCVDRRGATFGKLRDWCIDHFIGTGCAWSAPLWCTLVRLLQTHPHL